MDVEVDYDDRERHRRRFLATLERVHISAAPRGFPERVGGPEPVQHLPHGVYSIGATHPGEFPHAAVLFTVRLFGILGWRRLFLDCHVREGRHSGTLSLPRVWWDTSYNT